MRASLDRALLEKEILPHLAQTRGVKHILLVGCDRRSARDWLYFRHKTCWTLDRNPSRRRFGGQRHIQDDVSRVENHFSPRALDAIVLNGILGFGVNAPDAAERMYAGCYKTLRRGGLLVLGWNDIPDFKHLAPDASRALSAYRKFLFPPLSAWRRPVDSLTWHKNPKPGPPLRARRWNHTFDFYRKP